MKKPSVSLLGGMALAIASLFTINVVYFSEAGVSASASGSTTNSQNSPFFQFRNIMATAAQKEYQAESDHQLVVPFYRISKEWQSTLTLNNQAPKEIQVGVTLYSLSGEQLDVPAVAIVSHDEKVFNLSDWATAQNFQMGSLAIKYFGADRVIAGAVKIRNQERSLIFDQQLTEPQLYFKSSRLEGVWWLPSRKAEMSLVLSNTGTAPLSSTVVLTDAHGNRIATQDFSLAAHETKFVATSELLMQQAKLPVLGGLSINYSGTAGTLFVQGLIQDETTGFSSLVELHDPQAGASSKLDGAGLRIGRVNGEQLTQIAVARNAGQSDVVLSTNIIYTNSEDREVVVPVHDVKLRRGESSAVDLSKAIAHAGIDEKFAGLEFRYDGLPGSVVVSSLSVSESGNQVFRVPLVDALNWAHPTNSGKYHLAISEGYSSLVYLKNVTNENQVFYMTIEFPGGSYGPQLRRVRPGQTLVYDLKQLRDSQIPDEDGKRLPRDLKKGFFSWSARSSKNLTTGDMEGPDNRVMIGRYEGADLAAGMSSTATYGCGCQLSYVDSWVERQLPNGSWTTDTYVELDTGQTAKFRSRELDQDCSGYSTVTVPANFGGSDDSIGTLSRDGDYGIVTGVDGGDLQVGAQWNADIWYQLYDCCELQSYDPTIYFQVRVKPPNISSISPSRGPVGNNTIVTISGQRFRNTQTLSAGAGITVTITQRSSTSITATFAVSENADSGNRDVKLTTHAGATSNAVQFYVQIPFAFTPSTPTQTSLGCATGSVGFGAQVPYTVTDNDGQAIALSGMTPEEKVTQNGTTDGQYRSFSTPITTTSSGTFTDTPIGTCFGPPVPQTNLCIIAKQEFSVKVPKAGGGNLTFFLGTTVNRTDCVNGIDITVSTGTNNNHWTLGTTN